MVQKKVVGFIKSLKSKLTREKTLLKKKLGEKPTKEEILELFHLLREKGWVKSRRPGNDGAVGNTLEDYFGLTENNLQTADAGEWELKTQRKTTGSMITLFHFDPFPRKPKSVVAHLLLPNYGWAHNTLYDEMSFRVTMYGNRYTDRGFKIDVDRENNKILVSFNKDKVDVKKHKDWLETVERKVGLEEINPQPYWDFQKVRKKAEKKLKNAFFVIADRKLIDGKEHFKYNKILELSDFNFDKFLAAIGKGIVRIDFDARTGHNHGTKFRLKQDSWPEFFDTVKKVT